LNPELSFDSYYIVYIPFNGSNKKKIKLLFPAPKMKLNKLNIILNNGRLEMKAPFSHSSSIALLEQSNKIGF